MWNARLIFREIERINPDFFPRAVYVSPENHTVWFERKDDVLTKDEFIIIYDKLGKALHQSSPFLSFKDDEIFYREMESNILIWLNKIQNLLWLHLIRLEDKKTLFYISSIGGKSSDSPHGNISRAIAPADINA